MRSAATILYIITFILQAGGQVYHGCPLHQHETADYENALYEKLYTTDCRAFFDVFWEEPYNGRLKTLGSEKFFMSPHSASNTKEFIREGVKDILNIINGLECD